jgi:hypothetical protein
MPTIAVFQLYVGMNKLYELISFWIINEKCFRKSSSLEIKYNKAHSVHDIVPS